MSGPHWNRWGNEYEPKHPRKNGKPGAQMIEESRAVLVQRVTTLAQMPEEKQLAVRAELEARELARAADPRVRQAKQFEDDERRARKSRTRRRR